MARKPQYVGQISISAAGRRVRNPPYKSSTIRCGATMERDALTKMEILLKWRLSPGRPVSPQGGVGIFSTSRGRWGGSGRRACELP
jgi:hypothetical protein